MMKKVLLLLAVLTLASCLRTRAEVGGQDQSYVYSKKNADNQAEAQEKPVAATPKLTVPDTAAANVMIDEKDELIRSLTGRLETLENQVATMQKEKETSAAADAQKIALLQEALAKLESQVQKLDVTEEESPVTETAVSADTTESVKESVKEKSAAPAVNKKLGPYETAEQYFAKKEWKKAILSYQRYSDDSPKGKNVGDAKYKIGVCFQELGMKEEAMAFYEEVAANYGKSEAGKKSKIRLAKLKK